MIVTSPFAGDVRPSARRVNGSRSSGRFTQGRSETSIPWPIATSLRVLIGKVRLSTLRTFDEARVAVERSALRRQCVNQSSTLTPVGRASGAASTA